MVGPNTIALKFENFFDPDIKERVKSLPDSRYDGQSREWFLRKDLKPQLLDAIGQLCIERGIQISDVPDFVYEIAKSSVPFSSGKGKVKGVALSYDQEAKMKPRGLDELPAKVLENLYEF